MTVCSENTLDYLLPSSNLYTLISVDPSNTFPNQPIILTNGLPNNFLYSDAWQIDTNSVGPQAQIVTYLMNATNNFNCVSNNFTLNATINPIPVVDFSVLNNPLCANSTIQFDNLSTTGISYVWEFGDGGIDYTSDPTHTFTTSDIFNVQLTAFYPLTGCTDSIDYDLTIFSVPVTSFSYTDSIACGPLQVLYTADVINSTWTYEWNLGNGTIIQQPGSIGYQFNDEGCYNVSLTTTNQDGCSYTSTYNNIACMYDMPIALFGTNDLEVDNYYPYFIFDNNSQNSNAYLWNFGDGLTSFDYSPSHMYENSMGNYNVSLVAYNEIGCSDTANLIVTVKEDLVIYVPNTFTPNEDEANQFFKPILSQGFKPGTYHLWIYNRWGELVFETIEEELGWDGSYSRHDYDSQIGTYTWVIEVDALGSQERKKYTGIVNLIR